MSKTAQHADALLSTLDGLGLTKTKLELPIWLQYGPLIAEFFLDCRSLPYIYHFTLTHCDRPEILHWGQENSEKDAHRAAKMALHHLIAHAEDAA